MKVGMKLATVYVAAAILVAGCGKSDSSSAGTNSSQAASANTSSSKPAATQSQSPLPQKSSGDSVDGYKSFKFGMKPSELSKLAECGPNDYNYEDEVKMAEAQVKAAENERKGIFNEIDSKIAAEEDVLIKVESQMGGAKADVIREKISQLKTEYSTLDKIHADKKERIKYLKKEVETLKSDSHKEDYYSKHLHCKVNFAGEEAKPKLIFNDQKRLSSVGIDVGSFNQTRFDSLNKNLQEKYPLSSAPSDVALATYNQDIKGTASWFFAGNGVELKVSKEGFLTNMSVHYHDAISAKEAFKASQKGKVSSGDL